MSRTVARAFDRAERRQWDIETRVLELAKQFGDLARQVLVVEGYYLADRDNDPSYSVDIGDELADILHAVFRIADHYDIDLEAAHVAARRREMAYLGLEAEF